MKPFFFFSIFFFVLFLSLNLFPIKANAQADVISLVVSPPTFELTANPGGEIVNSIKVTNATDKPIVVKTSKRNFTAVGEEGSVTLEDEDNGTFSLASWMYVDPAEVTIEPKETRLFNFQIKVPVGAEPGGHFGSVVFMAGGIQQGSGGGAAVAEEIASLVLLKIAGDIKEEAKIETFTTEKAYYEYAPVTFDTRVKNIGNVHMKPTGFISVTNIFGKQVAKIDVNTKNVLPGAIRKYQDKWESKWLVGKYTATLVLNYANGNKTLSQTTNFIVFPHKIAGAVLAVAIILLLMLLRLRKRLKLAFKILFGKSV